MGGPVFHVGVRVRRARRACIAADFQLSRAYSTRVLWLLQALVKSNIEFYVPSWNRFLVVLNAADVASGAVIIQNKNAATALLRNIDPLRSLIISMLARCTLRCQYVNYHQVATSGSMKYPTLFYPSFFAGILTTFFMLWSAKWEFKYLLVPPLSLAVCLTDALIHPLNWTWISSSASHIRVHTL